MNMTRRSFLKQALTTLSGIVLTQHLGVKPKKLKRMEKSRVVLVRHPRATDGGRVIRTDVVRRMLDEALKRLTGKPSTAEAWSSLLPDLQPHHIIAIKVNAIPPGRLIPTHPEVVEAIVEGLKQAKVRENNIIIYDRESDHLAGAGYRVNTGSEGVRCFGTTEEGWGYDRSRPVEILRRRYFLSSILTRCDHLINVPVLKVHLDRYGVTLSLKNHYGSVDKPRELHENFAVACATLNAQPEIRDKTRLVVIDALFGCWGSQPMRWVVDFIPNSLIVSRDPVAADMIGARMLNEERARQGHPPRSVPLLAKAAEIGLGTNNPERIDLQVLNMKS